mmetsp:Transcript_68157/g.200131  ORF Transcript_68157/g.200131 Transcript_68157/m.200131 type:complete len:360 (-) Transcript_68157:36-1115(-)
MMAMSRARVDDPSPYLRLLRKHHPQIVHTQSGKAMAALDMDAMGAVPHQDVETRTPSTVDSPSAIRFGLSQERSAGSIGQASDDYVVQPDPAAKIQQAVKAAQAMSSATKQCPHCQRMFSTEAHGRHVPICMKLGKSRPKPPKKEIASTFTDALGRRVVEEGFPGAGRPPSGVRCPSRGARRPASSASQPTSSAPPEEPAYFEVLRQQWGELQFLVKDGDEALQSDKRCLLTLEKAEVGLCFIQRLESEAKRLAMRKGALSRMLLPFDSETNSNDQASSAGAMPLGSKELNGLLPEADRREMVAQAIGLRKLIRVKVADCNDVDQAKNALQLLVAFLRELKARAAEERCQLIDLLGQIG